jgi:hypothetical protein
MISLHFESCFSGIEDEGCGVAHPGLARYRSPERAKQGGKRLIRDLLGRDALRSSWGPGEFLDKDALFASRGFRLMIL